MKTEIAKTITLSESEIQTAIINYIEKEKQIRLNTGDAASVIFQVDVDKYLGDGNGQNSIKASLTLKTIE